MYFIAILLALIQQNVHKVKHSQCDSAIVALKCSLMFPFEYPQRASDFDSVYAQSKCSNSSMNLKLISYRVGVKDSDRYEYVFTSKSNKLTEDQIDELGKYMFKLKKGDKVIFDKFVLSDSNIKCIDTSIVINIW